MCVVSLLTGMSIRLRAFTLWTAVARVVILLGLTMIYRSVPRPLVRPNRVPSEWFRQLVLAWTFVWCSVSAVENMVGCTLVLALVIQM